MWENRFEVIVQLGVTPSMWLGIITHQSYMCDGCILQTLAFSGYFLMLQWKWKQFLASDVVSYDLGLVTAHKFFVE